MDARMLLYAKLSIPPKKERNMYSAPYIKMLSKNKIHIYLYMYFLAGMMNRIELGNPQKKSLSLKNLLNKYTSPPPLYGFRKRRGRKVMQGDTINDAKDFEI